MARTSENRGEKDRERIADAIRKLAYMGAGTLFLTQESVSRLVSEQLKLPRELASATVAQVEKTRQDAVQSLTTMIASYLESLDLIELAQRVLNGLEVDVSAQVRFGFRNSDAKKRTETKSGARPTKRPAKAEKLDQR